MFVNHISQTLQFPSYERLIRLNFEPFIYDEPIISILIRTFIGVNEL